MEVCFPDHACPPRRRRRRSEVPAPTETRIINVPLLIPTTLLLLLTVLSLAPWPAAEASGLEAALESTQSLTSPSLFGEGHPQQQQQQQQQQQKHARRHHAKAAAQQQQQQEQGKAQGKLERLRSIGNFHDIAMNCTLSSSLPPILASQSKAIKLFRILEGKGVHT